MAGPLRAAVARTVFANSIRAVGTSVQPGHAYVARLTTTAAENSAMLTVEVALRMRNFDELQARIASGELIPAAEMTATYFPTQGDYDRVVQWVQGQGLTVTRNDNNRLAVFATGTVAQLAQAFQVQFARVVVDAAEYTSAITAPGLPAELSAAVLGVHGLQPHIRPHVLVSSRGLLQPNATATANYLPSQIATAYGASGLNLTGSGQTIAIYALAFPSASDLDSFWAHYAHVSQSSSNVQFINVAGGPGSSPTVANVQETTLDVEWAGALAPGAAIRVYAASAKDPGSNDEILQQVYADASTQSNLHLNQFCICYGGNEKEVSRDYLIIEAQYMASLASAGVTIFSASGDNGASPNGVLQVTYPTSDPSVTGVGGTTLNLNSVGTVGSETGWSGGGGGLSVVFNRPTWQTGLGVPPGTTRCVPDVAADADPSTGGIVIYNGAQYLFGGTSLATPIWTAFCALLNQSRASAGQAPLGALNPKIYPLLGTNSFRDITSGSNGAYTAGPGYDLVTGLGVSVVANLVNAGLASNSTPVMTSELPSPFATVGQPATLFVSVVGAPTLVYQWQRQPAGATGWSNLTDGPDYTGSAQALLVVNNSTSAMSGDQFHCVVSNAFGSVTSAPVLTLTVAPTGVTTLAGWPDDAGNMDGTGWKARFSFPGAVRIDKRTGNLYVGDSDNNTVRMVTPAGVVTTVAGSATGTSGSTDGPALSALFNGIGGVAVDPAGIIYVADTGNYTIRKIGINGVVSTLAGLAGSSGHVDGTGSAARFTDPENLAVDAAGNIYVADGSGYTVRLVTPAGVVTTLAGSGVKGSADGTGTAASFSRLLGVTVDTVGNVYVGDFDNNTVRKITPAGAVSTLAGTPGKAGSQDGTGPAARFDGPTGLAVDGSGNVFVCDSLNDLIREVTSVGVVTTVAGQAGAADNVDGPLLSAQFSTPGDITLDSLGILYVADSTNDTIRRIVTSTAGLAPVIGTQPASQTVAAGSSVSFSVTASGAAPLTYQWSFNGVAIGGATAATYTLSSAASTNAGNYAVMVTGPYGSVASAAATLTVTGGTTVTPPPPSSGGGGGGGGGGAVSGWFLAALALLSGVRLIRGRRITADCRAA
ncbi:MAG: protease pro-enzyme activation domain-containing protein [Opitutales bacterium]